ncbi:hypothetical protein ACP275_12G012500 [Erythranthe tilingii]
MHRLLSYSLNSSAIDFIFFSLLFFSRLPFPSSFCIIFFFFFFCFSFITSMYMVLVTLISVQISCFKFSFITFYLAHQLMECFVCAGKKFVLHMFFRCTTIVVLLLSAAHLDLETGDSSAGVHGGGWGSDPDFSDPFDIANTKNASHESLKRWRQAALVLNASRRFHYTLDLKKDEEQEKRRRMIRAHAQVIRAALLFKLAGQRQ